MTAKTSGFLLILLFSLFAVYPTQIRADPVINYISYPNQINSATEFTVSVEISSLEQGIRYFLKAFGGSIPADVQTYNNETDKWLNYISPWTEFPVLAADDKGGISTTLKARFKYDVSGIHELKLRIRSVTTEKNFDSQPIAINVTASSPTPSVTPTPKPTATAKPTATPKPEPTAKQVLSDQSYETPALYAGSIGETYWDDPENETENDEIGDLQSEFKSGDVKDYRAKNAGKNDDVFFASEKLNGKLTNIRPASYLLVLGGTFVLSAGLFSILRKQKKGYNLESDKNEDETLND